MDSCKMPKMDLSLAEVDQVIADCEVMIAHLANQPCDPEHFPARQQDAWFWRREWVRAIALRARMLGQAEARNAAQRTARTGVKALGGPAGHGKAFLWRWG